ncbi:MAG: imidazole glycerol phosphate synthase subunit HisH [Clostridia bacterium]|nr:imidazole glycerol phosphate synthase subunit HisH [Clostridia bacterium]
MIGIIDCGAGNIFSLQAAFERLGTSHRLITKRADVLDLRALVLPGVGAFGDAIHSLKANGMDEVILEWIGWGKPLLGICLGMQLLFEKSEEHGVHEGLKILPGTIRKITGPVKVPHMGWNRLNIRQSHTLFQDFTEGYVYFVHSYYAATIPEVILATTKYSEEMPVIVGKDNVLGMQFHPEKSGPVGMRLLSNWLKLVEG